MKQLYISDLDGTLLNGSKEVSEYTRKTINLLAQKGVYFSIATARSSASAVPILSGLEIDIPVVLMNGVVIYDLGKKEYVKTESIDAADAMAVVCEIKRHGGDGFMYAAEDSRLVTYYERLGSKAMQDFYDERIRKYSKYFEQTTDLSKLVGNKDIIYFTLIDRKEPLAEILVELENIPGINAVLYKDNYSENLWYLEVFGKNASKRNAVRYLRREYGFDRITGFGDNVNDLPLLEACDEFYAVSNAVDELKRRADGIIGDNGSDAVARFIAGCFEQSDTKGE